MIDTIATFVLVMVLVGFEWKQQRLIKLAEKPHVSKYFIVVALSVVMISLFWSSNWQANAKVVAVIILMINVAVLKQGLGRHKVITFGSVGKARSYQRYEEVVIGTGVKGGTSVTFYGHKSGHFSLEFSESNVELNQFLKANLPDQVKVITELEFDKHQQNQELSEQQLQSKRINAVRNRQRLTIKRFVKGK